MPKPVIIYKVDNASVIARGVEYTEEQLDEAINGPVKDLLLDKTGTSRLEDMLSGLASTEFDQEQISQLLQVELEPEGWRVGEALAEAYVSDNDNCVFPWPASRDLKNPKSSPAGADLAGFQETDDETNPFRFAFGEVKTSSDKNHPPSVMHGRGGLKNQLTKLRDSYPTKRGLILYLGHHAVNASWRNMFESAIERFLSSEQTDIAIFGVLIRDVPPDASDLSRCADSLADSCPASTNITLYALYLPVSAISSLPSKLQSALRGD